MRAYVRTYVRIDYVHTCVSTCVYVCINEYALELVADDQIRRRPGRPKISAIGRLAGRPKVRKFCELPLKFWKVTLYFGKFTPNMVGADWPGRPAGQGTGHKL